MAAKKSFDEQMAPALDVFRQRVFLALHELDGAMKKWPLMQPAFVPGAAAGIVSGAPETFGAADTRPMSAVSVPPEPRQPSSEAGWPFVENARNEVHLRGEPLATEWWRGRQWSVTEFGLERRDGLYAIPAECLDGIGRSWPQHMAEKRDIDQTDFITAWIVALALHGILPDGEPGPRGAKPKCGPLASWRAEAWKRQEE